MHAIGNLEQGEGEGTELCCRTFSAGGFSDGSAKFCKGSKHAGSCWVTPDDVLDPRTSFDSSTPPRLDLGHPSGFQEADPNIVLTRHLKVA